MGERRQIQILNPTPKRVNNMGEEEEEMYTLTNCLCNFVLRFGFQIIIFQISYFQKNTKI